MMRNLAAEVQSRDSIDCYALSRIRNFGEKTLADVYARLEDLGFFRVDRRNQPPPEPEPADTRPPWMDFRRQD